VATVDARHKLIRTWSLADLGIDEADVGLRAAATVVRAVTPQTNRTAHLVVERDACSAAVRLADFLADRELL
jgi:electron transfer flavoprotein beta subunit